MADEVYNLAVNFGVHPAKLFAFLLDLLSDFLAFSNGDGSHGCASDPPTFGFFGMVFFSLGYFPRFLGVSFLRSCSASQLCSSSATAECGRTPSRGGSPCFLRSSSRR
jgi:hypothetical protein